MKSFKFEKKGMEFEAAAEKTECILKVDSKTAKTAEAYRHHKAGWGYEVTDKEIMKKLFGKAKGSGTFFVTHDSAEEIAKIIKEAEIEKSKKTILEGKISLSY